MKTIQNIVRMINNVFIQIVLFLFYFIGIGFGAMLQKVFLRKQNKNTYWQDVKNEPIDLSSPY